MLISFILQCKDIYNIPIQFESEKEISSWQVIYNPIK